MFAMPAPFGYYVNMNRLFENFFVARHGDYDEDTDELTETGRSEASAVARQLSGLGLGRRTILLASVMPRAVEAAGIIKEDLGASVLVRSPYITSLGMRPRPIKGAEELDAFVGKLLNAMEIDPSRADSALLVVHRPLVCAVAEVPRPRDGTAYEVTSQWTNSTYLPGFERILDRGEPW